MAHEITSTDGLVLTGKPAWHGIGVVVKDAPTMREALKIARLGWQVEQYPLRAVVPTPFADGSQVESLLVPVPGFVANVRSDTREVLSVVGDGYKVLQNDSLADLIDGLAADGAIPRAESAGSLRGGRNVFFLVRTHSFALAGSDEVHTYTLFSNAHDGSAMFRAVGTSVRVVCANTLRVALSERERSGIALRHTSGLAESLKAARAAIGILGKRAEAFQVAAESLVAKQPSRHEVREFFRSVYEKANGAIPMDPRDASEHRKTDRAVRVIAQWVDNMDDPRQRVNGTSGTLWAAVNAITQWSDHERTVRTSKGLEEDKRNARTHSNLFGSSADFKSDVFDAALALV